MAVIPNDIELMDVETTLKPLLESDGGVVGRNLVSYFTPDAVKNILAKRKPVSLAVNKCQDYESSLDGYYAEWWKGADGLCGILIPNWSDTGSEGDVWSYAPPVGTEASPYRLGDFRGYATSDESNIKMIEFTTPNTSNIGRSFDVSVVVEGGDDYTLCLADIFDSLHLTVRAVGGTQSVTKDFSTSRGEYQFTFTAAEISSLNASGGTNLIVQIFGRKNGVNKNLRYSVDAVTVRNIALRIALPFYTEIRVGNVVRNLVNPTSITISTITAMLAGRDADGNILDGGTLEDSVFLCYLHNGVFADAINGGDSYICNIVEVPSLSVASNKSVLHKTSEISITDDLFLEGYNYNKMTIVWLSGLYGELSSVTSDVLLQ